LIFIIIYNSLVCTLIILMTTSIFSEILGNSSAVILARGFSYHILVSTTYGHVVVDTMVDADLGLFSPIIYTYIYIYIYIHVQKVSGDINLYPTWFCTQLSCLRYGIYFTMPL
jgi:hypothetical protein